MLEQIILGPACIICAKKQFKLQDTLYIVLVVRIILCTATALGLTPIFYCGLLSSIPQKLWCRQQAIISIAALLMSRTLVQNVFWQFQRSTL